jgi:hypothetical protein
MKPHLLFQAKNIKNKPIINRDVQSIRFEEMQCEIMVGVCSSRYKQWHQGF